jgi:cyclase
MNSVSRTAGVAVAALSCLSVAKPVVAQAPPPSLPGINFPKVEFITQKLAPNVYILTGSPGTDPGHPEGAGGRVGVLVGDDGVLLVDASYAPLSQKIVAAVRTISPAPIKFVIDTHEHPDHTGGNANFAHMGAIVVAREEVWVELNQMPPPAQIAAIGAAASFTDPARLPAITYSMSRDPMRIRMDGEVVDIIAAPAAHTNGDTIVKFEHANVMMIGDFYRNYGYPFIDLTNGGSFEGVLQALDLVMQLSDPSTKLVPGHGTVITRASLPVYRDVIVAVRDQVHQMRYDGKSLQTVLGARLTAPYDGSVTGGLDQLPSGLGTSADRFVRALYTEMDSKSAAAPR